MSVFFFLGMLTNKFTRDHATVKFHQPRFSTDSLPIILHEIVSVKNELSKHAIEQSKKLSDLN